MNYIVIVIQKVMISSLLNLYKEQPQIRIKTTKLIQTIKIKLILAFYQKISQA